MSRSRPIEKLACSSRPLVSTLVNYGLAIWLLGLLPNPSPAQAKAEEENPPERHYFSQPHLGTLVQIAFYSNNTELSQNLAEQCFERVKKLNQIFSDYLPDSEVSRLSSKPINLAHKVSEELFHVIAQAQEISSASNGAFDITLGQATQKWRESEQQKKRLPKDATHASYKDLILDPKTKTILLRRPVKIDLGGIAKGYITDQLMLVLRKAKIKQAAVIIGGEMLFTEAPPGKMGWTVGIECPSREMLGTLKLSNTALSTSGDTYQFFEQDEVRHSHLIDPSSGKSKTDRLNVTTLAQSALLADAWATALRVLPSNEALELTQKTKEIEAAFIPFKKPATFTSGFPKVEKQ